MEDIRLNQQERGQLMEFLKAVTDERVKSDRAPFDHQSLCIPVGYAEVTPRVVTPDTSTGSTAVGRLVGARRRRRSDRKSSTPADVRRTVAGRGT